MMGVRDGNGDCDGDECRDGVDGEEERELVNSWVGSIPILVPQAEGS